MANGNGEMPKNRSLRGLILIIIGAILLLHTLGLIEQGLNMLLIIASLSMIVYGTVTSGIYTMIKQLLKRK